MTTNSGKNETKTVAPAGEHGRFVDGVSGEDAPDQFGLVQGGSDGRMSVKLVRHLL